MPNYKFPKKFRLRSKKIISELIKSNNKILNYPILIKWIKTEEKNNQLFQVIFVISKKKFKKAVERNRLKRLLIESFRLRKSILEDLPNINNLKIAIFYISHHTENFKTIDQKLKKSLEKLKKLITN